MLGVASLDRILALPLPSWAGGSLAGHFLFWSPFPLQPRTLSGIKRTTWCRWARYYPLPFSRKLVSLCGQKINDEMHSKTPRTLNNSEQLPRFYKYKVFVLFCFFSTADRMRLFEEAADKITRLACKSTKGNLTFTAHRPTDFLEWRPAIKPFKMGVVSLGVSTKPPHSLDYTFS